MPEWFRAKHAQCRARATSTSVVATAKKHEGNPLVRARH